MRTFFLFIILFLVSCTDLNIPTQQLKPDEKTYKRDIVICLNKVCREGSITMPLKASNEVHIIAPNNLDHVVVSNCSGEWAKPNAWTEKSVEKSGIFGWFTKTVDKKNELVFTYNAIGMERDYACPTHIYALQKSGTIQSWGFIDWQVPERQLIGELTCNGLTRAFSGVEICQTRKDLHTRLRFDEEVAISPDLECDIGATFGNVFEFNQPKGVCTIEILAKESRRKGRITLIGYEDILVR